MNQPTKCRDNEQVAKTAVSQHKQDKHSGYLFTGYAATDIEVAWTLLGLLYGTWESYRDIGGGLNRSSEDSCWKAEVAKGSSHSVNNVLTTCEKQEWLEWKKRNQYQ